MSTTRTTFLLIIFIILFYYDYTVLKKIKVKRLYQYDTIDCTTAKVTPPTLSNVTFSKDSASNTYIATIGGTTKIQIMCNLDVTSIPSTTTKVLQIVHGLTRDVKGYFGMANSAWGKNPNTLVWGPRFPIQSEVPDASYNYWTQMSWATGDASAGPSTMTSFEILDSINAAFFKACPGIKAAVLAGHSCGGQCLARYTGTSYLPELFPNVKIHYFILSPSTYLWLTADRPNPTTSCQANNWFLGLDRLNTYAAKMGASNIYCNYMNRNVVVMCGTQDTGTNMLDQSCGANAQGVNRYVRAQNFVAAMQKLNPKNFSSEYFNGGHSISWKAKSFTQILS